MVGTFLKLLKWVEDTVFPNVRDVYASRPIEDRWCYSLTLGKTVCPSAPFLWSSAPSKLVLLMILLGLGKRKKSHQVNREVAPVRRCSSQPKTAGFSGHCELVHCCSEAATICPATTLASPHALRKANATEISL